MAFPSYANDPDEMYCFARGHIVCGFDRNGPDGRFLYSRNFITDAQFRNIVETYFSEYDAEYLPNPMRARLTRRK